ncbi:hypothetical protein P7K49_012040 [Saguinus oedipus]|uniref:Charged multivesicular body protein 6 n=1 Tax=Saguinus oedipus TaxID=9490 RepID=A0ABQ9VSD6_SAGOE|nr:hypothetical protein P7K49_012040 [Saguinus oedipus]
MGGSRQLLPGLSPECHNVGRQPPERPNSNAAVVLPIPVVGSGVWVTLLWDCPMCGRTWSSVPAFHPPDVSSQRHLFPGKQPCPMKDTHGGPPGLHSVAWLGNTRPALFWQQLKQQRDKLRQYQKRIAQQLERERALARQLLRDGRKERAKLLLRKKRYQEQLLDRTENQISSLEAMVQSIEFTQIEMKVMEGLQLGNECLNKMHQVMSIEEVERILDETQEAVEYQRQIDELLAGSFTQEDEDAILEELSAITQVTAPRTQCGHSGDGTGPPGLRVVTQAMGPQSSDPPGISRPW